MLRMDVVRRAQLAMIVVSGVWIVGALSSLVFADIRVARFLRYSAFEVCDYINYHVCHCGNCWRDLMKAADIVDHPLINLALISLVPTPFLWLGTCATIEVLRWRRSD